MMGWLESITDSVGGLVKTAVKTTVGLPLSAGVDVLRMAVGKDPKHTAELIGELGDDREEE